MAKFQIFDENFKRNLSDSCGKLKDTVSDAILTEEGKLDTGKISSAARNTIQKVEDGVKDGCRKFSQEYMKDGSLDKEKLGDAANRGYQKAGRFLATSMTRMADKLADKFGLDGDEKEIIDSELVDEEAAVDVTANAEDFEDA